MSSAKIAACVACGMVCATAGVGAVQVLCIVPGWYDPVTSDSWPAGSTPWFIAGVVAETLLAVPCAIYLARTLDR